MVKSAYAKKALKYWAKIWPQLVVFPGYASLLLGWLAAIGIAILGFINLLGGAQPEPVLIPNSAVYASSGESSSWLGLVILSLAILAILAALWVYVTRWTAAAMTYLMKLFKLNLKLYWSCCVVVMVVGWLLIAVLAATYGDEELSASTNFIAAGAIGLGGLSFAAAGALKFKKPLIKGSAGPLSKQVKAK